MEMIPYGSPPPQRNLPTDVSTLQHLVLSQQDQMDTTRGDVTRLKDLAQRLNIKFESEQKRVRQVQEQMLLANVHARNLSLQNEDLRERIWHIESHGVETRHTHTLRLKSPREQLVIAAFGVVAIIAMLGLMFYAIQQTIS